MKKFFVLFLAIAAAFTTSNAKAALPTYLDKVVVGTHLYPSSNGLPLGSSAARWNIWANTINSTVSATELGYLDGASSNLQAQIDAITGAGYLSSALANGAIFVGNGSSVATARVPSGVLSMTNLGAFSFVPGAIQNADINAAAAIDYSKLNLLGQIVANDIAAAAGVPYSKLNLSSSILNADIAVGAAIAYSKLNLASSIVNSDVAAGASIAYSKLNLNNSVQASDIAAGAGIPYSKLNLASSIVNADVASGAAIAYSKLNLAASIINADIASGASIARTKLAPGTPYGLQAFDSLGLDTTIAPGASTNCLVSNGTQWQSTACPGGGGGGGTGEALEKDITQASHGFSVGDVIYYNGTAWAKAKADADSTSEVLGVVSAVASANDFSVLSAGYISGLSGLTAGTTYFLSAATAGAITATEPTTSGQVSKPVLVAISTTEAYVLQSRGAVIGGGVGGGFLLSSVLTTNVTSAPTIISQYRTFTKNGDSSSTDNAPSTSPSSVDGMRIFAKDFGTSGTSGQPNKWVFYVGLNKKVELLAYASTGRAGGIDVTPHTADSVRSYGISKAYDPTTGLLTISSIPINGSVTVSYIGRILQTDGSTMSQPTDCYFDVLVSNP